MAKILWLDLETTGTNEQVHGIVEIACILEINGKEVDSFHSYIRPREGTEYDPIAMTVNRHAIADLEEFPPEAEVFQAFLAKLDSWVDRYNKRDKLFIAGFNCEFDLRHTEALFLRNKEQWFGSYFWRDVIDLRSIASYVLRDHRPDMLDGKLMSVAGQLLTKQQMLEALGGGEAHGADVDIRVTKEAFYNIVHGWERWHE